MTSNDLAFSENSLEFSNQATAKSTKASPTARPRLDKTHGFFAFIKHNQIVRDEAHKIHEKRCKELKNLFNLPASKAVIGVTVDPTLTKSCKKDEKTPEKEQKEEEKIRSQVRRRFDREHPSIDEICLQFERNRISEAERTNQEDDISFYMLMRFANGESKSIPVFHNTKPARLAKELSKKYVFDDAQSRNLRLYIEEQLELREKLGLQN